MTKNMFIICCISPPQDCRRQAAPILSTQPHLHSPGRCTLATVPAHLRSQPTLEAATQPHARSGPAAAPPLATARLHLPLQHLATVPLPQPHVLRLHLPGHNAATRASARLQLSQCYSTFASSRSFSTVRLHAPRHHTTAHLPSRVCSHKPAAASLAASLRLQTQFFLSFRVRPGRARKRFISF